jgi:hypothetical protein
VARYPHGWYCVSEGLGEHDSVATALEADTTRNASTSGLQRQTSSPLVVFREGGIQAYEMPQAVLWPIHSSSLGAGASSLPRYVADTLGVLPCTSKPNNSFRNVLTPRLPNKHDHFW